MNEPRTHATALPSDSDREAAPDMLAELGPLAYGLVALSEDGPLSAVRTLPESWAAQVPAQADRSPEQDARSEALLGELGELDL